MFIPLNIHRVKKFLSPVLYIPFTAAAASRIYCMISGRLVVLVAVIVGQPSAGNIFVEAGPAIDAKTVAREPEILVVKLGGFQVYSNIKGAYSRWKRRT